MSLKVKSLQVFLALTQVAGLTYAGSGQGGATTEYYVKAAFVCQLIRFVEWPKGKAPEPNAPTVIGIVGQDPFGDAFDIAQVEGQGRSRLLVRRFKAQWGPDPGDPNQQQWAEYLSQLRACHVLYFVDPKMDGLKGVLEQIHKGHVLSIGQCPGFLEAGGIVNLLVPDPKIRFEVNLIAARQARLRIPAQVLRLAVRVIDQKGKD